MKPFINYIIIVAAMATTVPAMAQQSKLDTAQFEVSGVCTMCKKRIEDAAMYQKGVKAAEWNASTGMMTIIYRPDKTEEAALHEAIANSGHSTDRVQAPKDKYNELPECCRYEEVQKH